MPNHSIQLHVAEGCSPEKINNIFQAAMLAIDHVWVQRTGQYVTTLNFEPYNATHADKPTGPEAVEVVSTLKEIFGEEAMIEEIAPLDLTDSHLMIMPRILITPKDMS